MDVIRKDSGRSGAFKAMDDGTEIGEMTYMWRGNDKILIDHTGVEPEYEGRGVGRKLFDNAITFAQDNHVKIIPVCPFVVALCQRLPEKTQEEVLADY